MENLNSSLESLGYLVQHPPFFIHPCKLDEKNGGPDQTKNDGNIIKICSGETLMHRREGRRHPNFVKPLLYYQRVSGGICMWAWMDT